MVIIKGIFSVSHAEIVSAFYRGYSGYQTGNIVVIIRDIQWLSYEEYGGYHMYWLFYGGLLGNVDC